MTTINYADAFASITEDAAPLTIPLGVTAAGSLRLIDLAKAPHMLFAGTTGSGKSVGLNVAIATLVRRSTVEFVMIDPKRVELSLWRGARGVKQVITDMGDAAAHIETLVETMETRYAEFEHHRVRKLADYNAATGKNLPEIILVVDELSDLMDTHGDTVLEPLVRIGQLGRAAGIHMMLATQRPAADTIPKKLLANVPTRVAYQSQSHTESRLILGTKGAEQLKGKGDLLAVIPGVPEPVHAQGPFISDDAIEAIVTEYAGEYKEAPAVTSEPELEFDGPVNAEPDSGDMSALARAISELVASQGAGVPADGELRAENERLRAEVERLEAAVAVEAAKARSLDCQLDTVQVKLSEAEANARQWQGECTHMIQTVHRQTKLVGNVSEALRRWAVYGLPILVFATLLGAVIGQTLNEPVMAACVVFFGGMVPLFKGLSDARRIQRGEKPSWTMN